MTILALAERMCHSYVTVT